GQSQNVFAGTLISGTQQNGRFRGSATIPQFADDGTWRLRSLEASDSAGNVVGFGETNIPTRFVESAQFEVFGSTAPDFQPNPFSYEPVTDAEPSTVVFSDLATISGLEVGTTGATSSVSGDPSCWLLTNRGDVGIGGSVQIFNGDTAAVSVRTAAAPATSSSCVVRVGEGSATFTVRTRSADLVPDAFVFAAQPNVEPGSVVVSNSIHVSGIDAAVSIRVSNGQYSVNGGGYISTASTVRNGDRVIVRHRASAVYRSAVTTRLSIGTASADFTSTTRAADTTPDALAFLAQTDVALSSVRVSGEGVISGIEIPVSIGVLNGSYSINGGLFTSARGTVSNGDRIRIRHTASDAFSTTVTTRVAVGSVIAEFRSTTLAADRVPDPFVFEDAVLRAPILPRHASNVITVAGINAPSSITISGDPEAMYSVNGQPFTNDPGKVRNGDRVQLRNRIPLLDLKPRVLSVDATLTIGGVSDTWTVSTLPR
ncbi:MAG: hypothetical protein NTZ11_07230, partial [Gammaproteobacteria bacterium]|nr:hypothetical protein [Gammaproteobacteria bacterium]